MLAGRGHLGNIMMHGRNLGRQIALNVRNDDGPAGLDKDVEVQRSGSDGLPPHQTTFYASVAHIESAESVCAHAH